MKTLRLCIALAVAALTLVLGAGLASAAAVETLSTGVGSAERVPRKEFSTLLMFAEAKGPYLASIDVEVKDAAGKVVITTTSGGPWLFAKLPAGTYSVVATRPNGEKRAVAFTVTAERQEVVRITW